MNLSSAYKAALERYVEWAKCTTPFDRCAWSPRFKELPSVPNGLSAAEALMRFESLGEAESLSICSEPSLLVLYRKGKANRDFWFKEIGEWNRLPAGYVQEEFLCFLTPDCFDELFHRWPKVHLVRHIFDNSYSQEEFEKDAERFLERGIEKEQEGIVIYSI